MRSYVNFQSDRLVTFDEVSKYQSSVFCSLHKTFCITKCILKCEKLVQLQILFQNKKNHEFVILKINIAQLLIESNKIRLRIFDIDYLSQAE